MRGDGREASVPPQIRLNPDPPISGRKTEIAGGGVSSTLRDGDGVDSERDNGSGGDADRPNSIATEKEAWAKEKAAKLDRHSPVGEKYGKLTVQAVIGPVGGYRRDRWIWCKCECGRIVKRQLNAMRQNCKRGAVPECSVCKRANFVGEKFGKLTITRELPINDKRHDRPVDCVCDCGRDVSGRDAFSLRCSVLQGNTPACDDCIKQSLREKRTKNDRVGKRVGMLTIQSQWWENNARYVSCVCDCGAAVPKRVYHALTRDERAGHLVACEQCQLRVSYGNTLGVVHRSVPEYAVWQGMKTRCNNPQSTGYKDYGGRGIKICGRWNDSFAAFIEDMGPRPDQSYTIERKDVNGNYEPRNCVWATYEEQASNKRNSVHYLYRGRQMTLAQIAKATGKRYSMLTFRMRKGWVLEDALNTPSRYTKIVGEQIDS